MEDIYYFKQGKYCKMVLGVFRVYILNKVFGGYKEIILMLCCLQVYFVMSFKKFVIILLLYKFFRNLLVSV